MMGEYCDYCGTSCFVDRILSDDRWAHLHTCWGGMAHDQRMWGQDYLSATNPYAYGARHG